MTERKGVSPWTIIGWIVLAMIALPVGACVASIALIHYQDTRPAVEAARNSP